MHSRPTDAYFYNRVTKEVREAPLAEDEPVSLCRAASATSCLPPPRPPRWRAQGGTQRRNSNRRDGFAIDSVQLVACSHHLVAVWDSRREDSPTAARC